MSSDSLFLHDETGVSLDDHNPRGHVRSAEAATVARAESSARRGTSVMSKRSAAALIGFRFGSSNPALTMISGRCSRRGRNPLLTRVAQKGDWVFSSLRD